MKDRIRIGEKRAIAVAAAMVACAFNAWGDTDVPASNTTVLLDNLPGRDGTRANVAPGIVVDVTSGPAIFGQNITFQVFNQGRLSSQSANDFAVLLQNGNQLTHQGTITGVGGGVTMVNASGLVTHTGIISATTGAGVMLRAGGSLTNELGATITGGTHGIYLLNGSESVINRGFISATNGIGVREEGGSSTFQNDATGRVQGTTYGVQFVNGTQNMTNAGSVSASTGIGVDFGSGGTLVNSEGASITGATIGVHTRNGSADIQTSGAISGGTYSVQFETGNGKLTMRTGAVLTGAAHGGNTSRIVLEGNGSARNDFLSFGALDMTGTRWDLLARTEAKATTVSSGILGIGAPGTSGAALVADTITVNIGAALAAYDSTLNGTLTNNGTVYIGSGTAYPGAQPTTVLLNGSMNNANLLALTGGLPFGTTFRVSGNYQASGAATLTLGALLDDEFLGTLSKQVVDRLLVGGNASGSTQVRVITRTDSLDTIRAALTAATSVQAQSARIGVTVQGTLDSDLVDISPDSGASIIQVAGVRLPRPSRWSTAT